MWQCTCVPRTVYDFLYPFKPLFRCAQARHFVIFCWLLVGRVERSVILPVCAYLVLVRLYGTEEPIGKHWSLFQLKQRFAEAVMQEQVHRVEQKWRRKWRQIKEAA